MQENPNAIPEGETPHNVTLLCYDPMTDMTKPGDRITVTGIYKAHPLRVNPRLRTLKTVYKANIDIVHIQREETSTLFSVSERGPMRLDDGAGVNTADTQNDGLFQVRPRCAGWFELLLGGQFKGPQKHPVRPGAAFQASRRVATMAPWQT